ncbi:lactonase family protein [Flammeovirga kamogawensis]|uniref:Lactonase family protein n=1 Tax=Flammeovirga kamogawensis TaxID=373891 RepID=A0ABX8GVZ0_9BACT|nr:lactonase family protein [Flammeovirga kamogawensis]MBB6461002.1 hypothetical protein [Flammeovirga kamogawensis]QWG07574.1 lactonase family protein [Flammeovirga kamogawensis]TRX69386.1 lactonase family protein [Flammeovirga kamogawensis]
MNKLLKKASYALLIIIGVSCSTQEPESALSPTEEEASNIRMPFSQKTFLCDNKRGKANIYEIDYDFQGLSGDANLTLIASINGHSHIAVSPDKRWVVVVGNGSGKITLVGIDTDNAGQQVSYLVQGKPRITQVDFDMDDKLFIAGKKFLEIATPVGGWGASEGSILAKTKYRSITGDLDIETSDEEENLVDIEEEYFNEDELKSTRPKFSGGDILFTQNSSETDGFEAEHLVSFTRHQRGKAMLVKIGTKNGKPHVQSKLLFKLNDQRKVTGAALVGDNHFIVSANGQTKFKIYSFSGDVIATPTIKLNGSNFKHANGDLASTQSFDKNSLNDVDNTLSSKEIDGEYYSEWYRGYNEEHQYAEIKLYRPGISIQHYPSLDLSDDNYNISKESRRNSANADLADYRKSAAKFTSLGKNNGYALLRFPAAITVSDKTTIQVVETTWGKLAEYESQSDATAAYNELASVYVKVATDRFYTQGFEDNDWIKIGDAHIANNEFTLSNINGIEIGDQVQWIKIVDDQSKTGDGFDINFISSYEK